MSEDTIDFVFIIEHDRQLIDQDVPLYSRPFRTALAWLELKGRLSDLMDPQLWEPLMSGYKELYPSGSFSFPLMLEGGVRLRDSMYSAIVNISYGVIRVEPLECIDISKDELKIIWKHYPDHVWQAIYSVADLWDFAYGLSDLKGKNIGADQLWHNAGSVIAGTAKKLVGRHSIDMATQDAHLAAELAIKGALLFLGWSEKECRKLNHDLLSLAEALIKERPTSNDNHLKNICAAFPDFIGTRYKSHGLSRVRLLELAADALRRVSTRNLAGQLGDLPPRWNLESKLNSQ